MLGLKLNHVIKRDPWCLHLLIVHTLSHSISSHGIDLVVLKYSGFSTWRLINWSLGKHVLHLKNINFKCVSITDGMNIVFKIYWHDFLRILLSASYYLIKHWPRSLTPHETTGLQRVNHDRIHVNSLHAKLFRGNKNIYSHFTSFLHIDMTQVVEILPQVRQGPTYST